MKDVHHARVLDDREVPHSAPQGDSAESVCCPTCLALQVPSQTCRRCGCDLTLLMALRDEHQRLRERCLALIRQRRLVPATRLAQRCYELSSDTDNARMLATCYLLRGDFSRAVKASCWCDR